MLDDRYTPEDPDLDEAILEQAKMMIRELHSLLSEEVPAARIRQDRQRANGLIAARAALGETVKRASRSSFSGSATGVIIVQTAAHLSGTVFPS